LKYIANANKLRAYMEEVRVRKDFFPELGILLQMHYWMVEYGVKLEGI
jgi:hypothetical protein